MTTILVVEDESSFREALSYMLTKEGFTVQAVENGQDALVAFRASAPDLVLLDVMLPGLSGTEVCRAMRSESDVPIIMVTAKDTEIDKVVGLEIGADDYVTKPFSTPELVARIKAALRRRNTDWASGSDTLQAGPVRVDTARHVVTVDGTEIAVPLKEYELLVELLRSTGRVLTRSQLIDRVWGWDYVGDTKTLDVHIKRLRGRIEPDPSHPVYLKTVRGVGFKFEAEPTT